ncbi:hypothetical protein ACFWZW_03685 [Microbacterium enclense]|uniref:hypothetical protein n=1 Tax=Microbacterium enclense TaxID=993073 RepID=UPI0036DA1E84
MARWRLMTRRTVIFSAGAALVCVLVGCTAPVPLPGPTVPPSAVALNVAGPDTEGISAFSDGGTLYVLAPASSGCTWSGTLRPASGDHGAVEIELDQATPEVCAANFFEQSLAFETGVDLAAGDTVFVHVDQQ